MVLKQTQLSINGPILAFTSEPVNATVDITNSAEFSGFATASFPEQTPENPAVNDGTLSYRWYNSVLGELTDGVPVKDDGTPVGVNFTGTGTTVLTLENALDQSLNQTEFWLVVDYVPSAYSQPVGSAVVAGTARSTANAVNEPFRSDSAILTVRPLLEITVQPQE